MASEVGVAYVSLVPSFSGGKAAIQREMGRALAQAGKEGGKEYGRAVTDAAKREVDGKGVAAKIGAEAGTGLKSAGKESGKEFGNAFADAAEVNADASGVADGISSKLKMGLAAGGVAAGAALAAGFGEAMERERLSDRVGVQLGATGSKAKQYGKIAGDLYAGAWGESMEQVSDAISGVVSSVPGMRKASGREIETLTASVLDFASAFDVDVARATQVAGQMIRTGLAKDGGQALDLLFASMQSVPAAVREDLLDAMDEYGPFMQALGLTGQEAMGLLAEGAEKGMYGIDKAGDAVKEFTIRATDMSELTKGAYKTIGLGAQDMTEDILAGGDRASGAFDKIVTGLLNIRDPAKRANTAIALFGTPMEDLSVSEIPAFLKSLRNTEDRLGKTAGAARRAGRDLNDNAATRFTEFKRTLQTRFVDFVGGTLVPAADSMWKEIGPDARRLGNSLANMGEDIGPVVKDTLPIFANVLGDVAGAVGKFATAFNKLPAPVQAALVSGGLFALLRGRGAGGGGALAAGVAGGAAAGAGAGTAAGAAAGGAGVGAALRATGRRLILPAVGVGLGMNWIDEWMDKNLDPEPIKEFNKNLDLLGSDFSRAMGRVTGFGPITSGVEDAEREIAQVDAQLAKLARRNPGRAFAVVRDLAKDAGMSASDLARRHLPKLSDQLDNTHEDANASARGARRLGDQWGTEIPKDARKGGDAARGLGKDIKDVPDKHDTKFKVDKGQAERDTNAFASHMAHKLRDIDDEDVKVKLTGLAKLALEGQGPLSEFARGGPITGGVPGRDSVLAAVMPGEHIFTADDVKKAGGQDAMYAIRRMIQRGEFAKRGDLQYYAAGGAVGINTGIATAGMASAIARIERRFDAIADALGEQLSDRINQQYVTGGGRPLGPGGTLSRGQVLMGQRFAKAQAGKPYQWGGTGNPSWDCSGMVGGIWAAALGRNPYQRYFTTASFGSGGGFGFRPGGGVFTVGNDPGSHMASNMGGLGVESRGGDGVVLGSGITPLHSFRYMAHYDDGGVLKPGRTLAVNNTGRDEYITRTPPRSGAQRIVLDLGEGMRLRGWMREEIDGAAEYDARIGRMR